MTKMRMTETHVYFLGGPFSHWAPSRFTAFFAQNSPLFVFNCGEQYMMAFKAFVMEDYDALERIMRIEPKGGNETFFRDGARAPFFEIPKAQKVAGRAVRGFDQAKWDAACMPGVFVGNFCKFTQNPKLQDALLATGDRILVEGASYDKEWGVGIDWSDPLIEDEANWRGKNRLGKSLVDVRTVIPEVLRHGLSGFDPFARAYREAA